MAKKVLVTGGSGRLGNYVSPYLKSKGYLVTNFDQNPSPPDSACETEQIPFVMGDLTNLGDCMRAIAHAQPDVIVHLAAIPFNSEIQPAYNQDYDEETQLGARFIQRLPEDLTMRANVMGTYYILDAARRMGVKHVVAASSYFALGLGFRLGGTGYLPAYLPIDEELPCEPEDTYSLSKFLGEEIQKAYARAYGIKSVAFRLLGVFYPDSERHRQMYQFDIKVPETKAGQSGRINNTTYQYVDARDIAIAAEQAIEAKGLSDFEAFYLATDTLYKEPTVDVIRKHWTELSGLGESIEGTEGIISIAKAQKLLGYQPQHSWRNGR